MIRYIFALVFFLLALSKNQAQIASFNFSQNAQSVSGWTNLHGNPAAALITATDAGTGFAISSIGTTNWAPYSDGHCSFDGGGASGGTFFPAGVMVNHWFQFSTYYGAYNALLPQLQISGLNRDSVYTIKMSGSFTIGIPNNFETNPTRYTVAGAGFYGYVDVNCDYNTANGATFHNIAPDSNGKVRIFVNTVNGSNAASLSGLQIITGRTAGTAPTVSITSPDNGDILAEDANYSINAAASETGGSIARVEFYINSSLVATDSVAPYSFAWNSPDEGHYTLEARAVDGTGGINTSTIVVDVQPLSTFWSLTGNVRTNADSFFLGTVDTNRLAIRTNNLERVSILGNGSVGIGTKNTFGYLLAVNGSAIFTKVRVKTAGTWPDYVFDRKYHLLDLEELDRYIKAHKHLPGMMPAAEAGQEGLDVATEQAALLKKVEEMTLYLIEENKKLKAQNQELEAHNARLKDQAEKMENLQQQIDALKKLIEKGK
jgi:hypothetical protein